MARIHGLLGLLLAYLVPASAWNPSAGAHHGSARSRQIARGGVPRALSLPGIASLSEAASPMLESLRERAAEASAGAPALAVLGDRAAAALAEPTALAAAALGSAEPAALAVAGGAAALVALGAAAAATRGPAAPIGAPYEASAKAYDPDAAEHFYASRLPAVASRLARLALLTGGFNARLLYDFAAYKAGGAPEEEPWPNEAARAKEALGLATQLGPTFIKLAQALSIRTDLIPESYALELRKLQDAVPPFDSAEAKEIMARELGVSRTGGLSSIFRTISDEPLASASIGQVYKAELYDGRSVAVKVQRPSILDDIALDLYILRLIAPLQTRVSNAVNRVPTYPDDIALAKALVDEWGRGFVAETDYRYEAANTEAFRTAMERRSLNAVTAPTVVAEHSTGRVLTTQWVDGTRLDLDASPDVPRLCGVAINAYLTMLLDTGVLHCDPHPGNLLRTTDGKLCILDWGMTLAVPEDLQYSLIEFIAHVNAEDYDAMPQDFVNLGFTPEEQLERVKSSNLTEGLSFVLRQLSQGGGGKKLTERVREEMKVKYDPDGKGLSADELREAAKADMQAQMYAQLDSEGVDTSVLDVTAVMEQMAQRNREMFVVPPYILYVGRAFSTLEGIGLSANDDYSIVSEAFPYLSQRLLTDDSPRAKAALRSMIYGPAGADGADANAAPSLSKLFSMGEGFASYSSATGSAPQEQDAVAAAGGAAGGGAAGGEAQEALVDLLLSTDGNYVQELLLDEAAKLADAAVRDSLGRAGTSAAAETLRDALRAPKRLVDSLPLPGPLKSFAAIGPQILDDVSRLVPALAQSDAADAATLSAFGELWDELSPRLPGQEVAPAPEPEPAAAERGLFAPPQLPQLTVPPALASVQTGAGPLLDELQDPASRLRTRLPMIGSLSRRFGSALLRRVADRLEADAARPGAPELARNVATRAAAADRSIAEFIEPQPAAGAHGSGGD